ncbi:hypothetical protein HanXRQr2_Chr09g0366921 [Helianthus annuus]|uniref:Uncharacterized protein n=1 Tax=Helianthus annuus TaxID=4232 RepID=A0A9K3I3I3_HELAN|nr:hypothetical protein HanXRQr2_Chr09g0366921 [Helianthus annuus]
MWGLGIFVVFEFEVFIVLELGLESRLGIEYGFESGLDVAGLEMVVVVVGYGSVAGKRETSGVSWSPEVGGDGGDRRSW